MSETHTMRDGTQLQQSLKNATPWRNNAEFQMFYPIECVVYEVIMPDSEQSRSKSCIEYNLAVLGVDGLNYLKNVPFPRGFNYYGDGDEHVLHPATKSSDPNSPGRIGDEQVTDYQNTDGDRVAVLFIQGSWTRPYITDVLPHPLNPVRSQTPGKAQAKLVGSSVQNGKTGRTVICNGTRIDIDEDGNIIIAPYTHSMDDTIGDKKKIQFVTADGTTNVLELTHVSGGWAVNFGQGADQVMVLGNALADFLTSFVNTFNTHTHPATLTVAGATTPPPASVPVTGSATGSTSTPSSTVTHTPANYQSQWIKSKQAPPT